MNNYQPGAPLLHLLYIQFFPTPLISVDFDTDFNLLYFKEDKVGAAGCRSQGPLYIIEGTVFWDEEYGLSNHMPFGKRIFCVLKE